MQGTPAAGEHDAAGPAAPQPARADGDPDYLVAARIAGANNASPLPSNPFSTFSDFPSPDPGLRLQKASEVGTLNYGRSTAPAVCLKFMRKR